MVVYSILFSPCYWGLFSRLGADHVLQYSRWIFTFHQMADTHLLDDSESLPSKKDPGASRLGNFINYYQFHSPEDRLSHLPANILPQAHSGKIVCLDIGCNSGDLTQEIYGYMQRTAKETTDECTNKNMCYILGIDIDQNLILRAKMSNRFKNYVHYETLDIMNDGSKSVLNEYLKTQRVKQFNAIFCFSVTMWIHLNHGDEGLKQFLSNICQMTDVFIIEPQPWKCYLAAVRRLKKNKESFPDVNELRMNKRVDSNIIDIIEKKHKFNKIYESNPNSWGRKIIIFQKSGILNQ